MESAYSLTFWPKNAIIERYQVDWDWLKILKNTHLRTMLRWASRG